MINSIPYKTVGRILKQFSEREIFDIWVTWV